MATKKAPQTKSKTVKVYQQVEDLCRDLGLDPEEVVVGHNRAAEEVDLPVDTWRPLVWRGRGVQPIEGVAVASSAGGQMQPVYRKSDLRTYKQRREQRLAARAR